MMMQRRNASKNGGEGSSATASSTPAAGVVVPSRIGRGPLSGAGATSAVVTARSGGGGGGVSPVVLLLIAAVLTIATYMFPEAEQVQEAIAAEQKLQSEVKSWWSSSSSSQQEQRKPPIAVNNNINEQDDTELRRAASERMLKQDSKWVDGEKKLKAKLKILAERQAKGLDLGVPVATRYLGEDIPAWPGADGSGLDVEAWNAAVKKKYDEMRIEEEQWKEMVSAIVNSENRG